MSEPRRPAMHPTVTRVRCRTGANRGCARMPPVFANLPVGDAAEGAVGDIREPHQRIKRCVQRLPFPCIVRHQAYLKPRTLRRRPCHATPLARLVPAGRAPLGSTRHRCHIICHVI